METRILVRDTLERVVVCPREVQIIRKAATSSSSGEPDEDGGTCQSLYRPSARLAAPGTEGNHRSG
jgi:hypothetical protein